MACLFIAQNLEAKVYPVAVLNNRYEPKEITIQVGDTVVWTNSSGHHNVNGAKSVFASNPVSFGNNLGMNWTFQYVFETSGTYDYQCDPHTAFGMYGKVIVKEKVATAVQVAQNSGGSVNLFPNPARSFVDVAVPGTLGSAKLLKIYSITGSLIESKQISANSFRYDVAHLKTGVYLMEVHTAKQKSVVKFVRN